MVPIPLRSTMLSPREECYKEGTLLISWWDIWLQMSRDLVNFLSVLAHVGSLEHMLIFCQALQPIRIKMMKLAYEVSEENEYLQNIIHWVMSHPNRSILVQFLLDCSCLPIVIESCQKWGPEIMERLFYISRNWCYSIHRTRMDMLKLPQFRWIQYLTSL